MANLKSLAKDTAIYGVSSIVGRFLNYLLVPLYTAKISAESGGYGVITNIYAYTSVLLVILTYGMETTFFRYANKTYENSKQIYATTLSMVGISSLLFIIIIFAFLSPISHFMGYAEHPSFVWVMFVTVAIDAFQCIPFAYLRYKKRPLKFAGLKLLFIALNIVLNLTYYLFLGGHDVGYAFYINLFCTASITLFFWKELKEGFFSGVKLLDIKLIKKMLSYSWPILVLGIAGMMNQNAGPILFPKLYHAADAHKQLGIFGASVKIAMIMSMIMQAFRYAYEPFVFGKAKDKDSKQTYGQAMKYYIIFTLLAFLVVMGYMNILQHLIAKDYREGLKVVPIVMMGSIMTGAFFNLSFWYKLIDKTIWGVYLSGIGCIVIISINIIFVPKYGYMACAWAGLTGNAVAMILSYISGQKYYPINYPLKSIFTYFVIALIFFTGITYSNEFLSAPFAFIANTIIILLFIAHIMYHDMPKGAIQKIKHKFHLF